MPDSLELLLYFAGFYLVQSIEFIPDNSRLFRVRALLATQSPGGAFRLLGVLPSSRRVIGTRLPFAVSGDRVWCATSLRRFQREARVEPRSASFESLGDAEAVGRVVRVRDRPFARAASDHEARMLAALLRDLSVGSGADRSSVVRKAVSRSLAVSDLEDHLRAVRDETWGLTYLCLMYLAVIVGIAAAAAFWRLPARFWLSAAAVVLVLHLVSVVDLWLTHRRLHPEARSERMEVVLGGALFPPALLAAPQKLAVGKIVGFHPVAVAKAVLKEDRFRALLRREVAELVYGRADVGRADVGRADAEPGEDPFRTVMQEQLTAFLVEEGLSVEDLLAHEKSDPAAVSYCPICLADFAALEGECPECRIPTAGYAADGPVW